MVVSSCCSLKHRADMCCQHTHTHTHTHTYTHTLLNLLTLGASTDRTDTFWLLYLVPLTFSCTHLANLPSYISQHFHSPLLHLVLRVTGRPLNTHVQDKQALSIRLKEVCSVGKTTCNQFIKVKIDSNSKDECM